MSDEELNQDPAEPKHIAEVLAADLMAYFNEFGASCEVCSDRSWIAVTGPDNEYAISTPWRPAYLTDPGYDLIVYPIICINCGNTKTISKYVSKIGINKMKQRLLDEGGAGNG